jgi:hypothetical protein
MYSFPSVRYGLNTDLRQSQSHFPDSTKKTLPILYKAQTRSFFPSIPRNPQTSHEIKKYFAQSAKVGSASQKVSPSVP